MLSKSDIIEFLKQCNDPYSVITVATETTGISGLIIKKENYNLMIENLEKGQDIGTRVLSIESIQGLENPDSEFYKKVKNEIKVFIVKFVPKNCLCTIKKQIQMTISENEDVTKRIENCLKKFGIDFVQILSIEEKKEK